MYVVSPETERREVSRFRTGINLQVDDQALFLHGENVVTAQLPKQEFDSVNPHSVGISFKNRFRANNQVGLHLAPCRRAG